MSPTDARWQFIAMQRELALDTTVAMPPPRIKNNHEKPNGMTDSH